LYNAIRGLDTSVEPAENTEFEHTFNEVMNDDFNTPRALAVLFDLARYINTLKEKQAERYRTAQVRGLLRMKLKL